MSRRTKGTPPPYCLHRQSGRAYVRLGGRQFMLGEHGSPESRDRYQRLLAEWEASGGQLTEEFNGTIPTVAELCAGYIDHCNVYYRRRDGNPTGEANIIRCGWRQLPFPIDDTYTSPSPL